VDVVVRLVPRQGYRHPDQQVLISGDGVMPVQKSGLFEAFATIFKNAPAGSYVRKVVTNDPSLKTNFRIQNDLVAFQTPTGTFITIKQLNI
jgi:hypothetical protein